jgi:hypothetical protein
MRKLPILVALLVLCSGCATHRVQTSLNLLDWANVMALSIEERIEVATHDGRRLNGTIKSIDAQSVVLEPLAILVRRDDIRAVWVVGSTDSLKNGTIVGIGAGAVVGIVAGSGQGNVSSAMTIVATGIGATLGAWIDRGLNGPPMTLIYSSR